VFALDCPSFELAQVSATTPNASASKSSSSSSATTAVVVVMAIVAIVAVILIVMVVKRRQKQHAYAGTIARSRVMEHIDSLKWVYPGATDSHMRAIIARHGLTEGAFAVSSQAEDSSYNIWVVSRGKVVSVPVLRVSCSREFAAVSGIFINL
jgi:hypothetical protein